MVMAPNTDELLLQVSTNRYNRFKTIGSAPQTWLADHWYQMEVTWDFASGSGRDRDKLALLAAHTEGSESPVLDDCLAWLDCRVFFRFDGGDRIYFFADVLSGGILDAGNPLSESMLIGGATEEQCAALAEHRDRDILSQRPLYREWREQVKDRRS